MSVCYVCNKPGEPGDELMDREGNIFHVRCFCCNKCKKNIAVEPYVVFDGEDGEKDEYLCEHCADEDGFNSDPCFRCGKDIVGDFMTAQGRQYCDTCYNCHDCGSPFENDSYFLSGEKNLICAKCNAKDKGRYCIKCKELIPGQWTRTGTEANSEFWHRHCFCCNQCQKPLDGPFIPDLDEGTRKPWCHDCYAKKYYDHCGVCDKYITEGKVSRALTKHYSGHGIMIYNPADATLNDPGPVWKVILFGTIKCHEDCFECHLCKAS